jgi:hypothetical protein
MIQELQSTNLLSLFDTTKAERQTFISDVLAKLDEGIIDPLKVHLQVKAMESIIEGLTKSETYKSFVLDAAQNHGSKSFEFGNASIQIKEAGTKYDYSLCGDLVYERLEKEAQEATEKLKARQKFLQTINGFIALLDEETGQVFNCYPPSKSSSTTVSVTLK